MPLEAHGSIVKMRVECGARYLVNNSKENKGRAEGK